MKYFILTLILLPIFVSPAKPKQAYYSWIDELRIRTTPGLNGKIIGSLKEGERVYYLNKQSKFKSEVILRNFVFNEPWLKVKTQKGLMGWVYGGGIYKVNESKYNAVIPKLIRLSKGYGDFYPIGWSKDGYFAYIYDHYTVIACEGEGEAVIVDLKKNKVVLREFLCWHGMPYKAKSLTQPVNYNYFAAEWLKSLDQFKAKLKQYNIVPQKTMELHPFPIKTLSQVWRLEFNNKQKSSDKNLGFQFHIDVILKSGKIQKNIYTNKNKNPANSVPKIVLPNPVLGYFKNKENSLITAVLKAEAEVEHIIVMGFPLPR